MSRKVLIFWSVIFTIVILRTVGVFVLAESDSSVCVGRMVSGRGYIVSDPEKKESGQVFIISTGDLVGDAGERCSSGHEMRIKIKTKLYPQKYYGEFIRFSGKLSLPFNFSADNGREFDYVGYLAKDGIHYEIRSAHVSDVDIFRLSSLENQNFEYGVAYNTTFVDGVARSVLSFLYNTKRRFVFNLDRVLGEPYSALASGLVVGEKSALGKELLDDFRIVGLTHIIVLSGFNITIVADSLRRVLGFLPRTWAILIGGLGMIVFGVLVGGGATVVRSCVMASTALFAKLIRRDYHAGRALLFAASLMVIENPLILFDDPSFQLSFLATLGLILLASPIESRVKFLPERFGLRGTVASTFATQIFVSPFILHMMGQISLIGVIVNILVLPLIPMTMLVVFFAGATGFIIAPISQVFGWFAHILLSYELFMVESFARVPYASIEIPPFSGWYVVFFYIVFFFVYWIISRRSRNFAR